jgi:hypothetical protein
MGIPKTTARIYLPLRSPLASRCPTLPNREYTHALRLFTVRRKVPPTAARDAAAHRVPLATQRTTLFLAP